MTETQTVGHYSSESLAIQSTADPGEVPSIDDDLSLFAEKGIEVIVGHNMPTPLAIIGGNGMPANPIMLGLGAANSDGISRRRS